MSEAAKVRSLGAPRGLCRQLGVGMVSDQETLFGLTALFCAGGVYLAVALARAELRRYRAPTDAERPYASRARLAKRLTGAALIAIIMAMMALGTYAIDFTGRPPLAVGYWGTFVGLVAALALIGISDLVDTRRIAYLERCRALMHLLDEAQKTKTAVRRMQK